jgi:hypothetical protein
MLPLIEKFCAMATKKTPWSEIFVPGAIMIRATGNPISEKLWAEMQASEDVSTESHELVKTIVIDESPAMGYAVFTSRSKFTYKGTVNDDLAVWTMVAKPEDGEWKVVSCQRSTGRGPDDTPPEFDV